MSELVKLKEGEILLGKLLFGAKMYAAARSVQYDEKGVPKHQDVIMQKYWRLVFCIESGFLKGKTPEETFERVGKLEPDDGEKLWEAYTRVNEVREGESQQSVSSSTQELLPEIKK